MKLYLTQETEFLEALLQRARTLASESDDAPELVVELTSERVGEHELLLTTRHAEGTRTVRIRFGGCVPGVRVQYRTGIAQSGCNDTHLIHQRWVALLDSLWPDVERYLRGTPLPYLTLTP